MKFQSLIIKVLFGLTMLATPSCSPLKYNYSSNELKFRTIGRIPIINGRINGKHAIFIVDTGASVSILNESQARHFGFWRTATGDQSIVGFEGESQINEVSNCNVEFGHLIIRGVTFRTRPLTNLAENIRQRENINIAGIIGSDILNHYKASIDYSNNIISFPQKVRVSKSNQTILKVYETGFIKLPNYY